MAAILGSRVLPTNQTQVWSPNLECDNLSQQPQIIGVFGLQRTYQEFELGMVAQVFQARVPQKKRPAGKSGIDAAFQPLKCDLGPI